ncbi:DUF2550 family protein [Janibacter cremeus]|uniref:DUF2550 family protein n=1 Tax=Janibacter cremeus TaxID=1285192 RepID=UPI0023F83E53|nr:DUF2550 family protein [Janibacter cremeus]WEV78350.1 DUF2550 family protein [Janibacter cremeus]
MSTLQVVEVLLLAGCLLLALWLVVLWLRRRALAAHGPMCPCAVRLPGSPRWRLGLLRMGVRDLDWFSVAGLTTSPSMSWAREGMEISTPAPEPVSLPGLDTAVAVTLTRGRDHLADLAVEPKIYPAVRSWLESAPPGHNVNVT